MWFNMEANILALSGIAIAIGVMGRLTYPDLAGKQADRILPMVLTAVSGDVTASLVIAAGLAAILGPTSQRLALERLAPNRWYAAAAGLAVVVVLILVGGSGEAEFYYFQF